MTRALKPYPAYRDSGLPWLGEVPKHWEMRRLRSISSILNGATPSSGITRYWNGDITWITPHDLGANLGMYIETSSRKITHEGYESCGTSLAGAGALVISTRAPIGYVAILNVPACINQGCKLVVPDNAIIQSEYLYYTVLIARSELASLGQGATFMELSTETLADFSILLPPLSEQAAIARYLDRACERIDRHIGAKERLIALLKERKQAIIDRAVTRGLDPNAPMKPTGIAWMPEVPAHWGTHRLKTCVADIVDMTSERESGDIYIALEHVESWTGKIVDMDFDTMFESQVKRFQSDDVLFGKLRPYLAKSARPDQNGVCVGEFLVLRSCNDNLLPAYLEILLRSKPIVDAIDASTFGAKMPRADWQCIGNMRVPVPPLSEQAAIVERLRRSTAAIDAAIGRARRQIDLLREYRERLIDDVVTGKLDVRGAGVDGRDPYDETTAGRRRGFPTRAFAGSDAPGA